MNISKILQRLINLGQSFKYVLYINIHLRNLFMKLKTVTTTQFFILMALEKQTLETMQLIGNVEHIKNLLYFINTDYLIAVNPFLLMKSDHWLFS